MADPAPRATLGVLTGRRRVGKTHLLEALVRAAGGLRHQFLQEERGDALRRLAESYAVFTGGPVPRFDDWPAAVNALLGLGGHQPVVVALDEVPYALDRSPELASALQAALEPGRRERSRVRLLLCGSAVSVMSGLIAGHEPLRGRASLVLTVRPWRLPQTAEFVGSDDPLVALLLHACLGGVPAYLTIMAGPAGLPRTRVAFDDWVVNGPLDPSTALFAEGQTLLGETPDLALRARDRALYESLVAGVAAGQRTLGGLANRLGRPTSQLVRPLALLDAAGLVRREEDAVHGRRKTTYLADPFLRFHYSVVRPRASTLLHGADAADLWRDAQATFRSQVLGPAFEEGCRSWALLDAPSDRVGGARPARVGRSDLAGIGEVDVVAVTRRDGGRESLGLLGEAKLDGASLRVDHVRRLEAARQGLAGKFDVSACRLVLFVAQGEPSVVVRRALARAGGAVVMLGTMLERGADEAGVPASSR